MSIQSFVDVVAPAAINRRLEGSPVFPSVRIAQSLLETGGVLHLWNNLIGFKVGSGMTNAFWHGKYVTKNTWEVVNGIRYEGVTANFRAYDSIEDGFGDQDLLFQLPRYEGVRTAATPQEQTKALVQGGYATDPQYAVKLNNLMDKYGLTKYDKEVEQVLQQLKDEIVKLKAEVAALQQQASLADIPTWAQAAVNEAVQKGLLMNPNEGSYDFYRVITILHRMNLF
jgi:flagellum-specific peptidoglycan hydrolase FlgJ